MDFGGSCGSDLIPGAYDMSAAKKKKNESEEFLRCVTTDPTGCSLRATRKAWEAKLSFFVCLIVVL